MIEVTCRNQNGTYTTKKLTISCALNLLKMSLERGWGWSLPKDSKYAYSPKDGVLYKKRTAKNDEEHT